MTLRIVFTAAILVTLATTAHTKDLASKPALPANPGMAFLEAPSDPPSPFIGVEDCYRNYNLCARTCAVPTYDSCIKSCADIRDSCIRNFEAQSPAATTPG
ncbi:MAG: hypothetical protein QOJ16_1083 [Acidobacteriota bacterium]|jgi:hypothetical protein|nr:hypothetical protein [Acidobacteriota bacterium]